MTQTKSRTLTLLLFGCIALIAAACGDSEQGGEHDGEGPSEHSEAGESVISDGDEESGIEYAKDETYDETRGGARLRLDYDAETDTFTGTVENTTDGRLENVRVEVHLSTGVELGPTTPGPLDPGQTASIELAANGETFDRWSAHPEVGDEEHSSGEEGEHDNEGSGEHGDG